MIEFHRQPPLQSGLDIAPLIDIIFLLLLFFILTSMFAEPGLPVELPQSASAEFQSETGDIHIDLLQNGDIGLNGVALTLDDLPAALAEQFHQTSQGVVTVNVDQNAPFALFVSVVDIAKAAGGETLILSAEVPR